MNVPEVMPAFHMPATEEGAFWMMRRAEEYLRDCHAEHDGRVRQHATDWPMEQLLEEAYKGADLLDAFAILADITGDFYQPRQGALQRVLGGVGYGAHLRQTLPETLGVDA